MISYTAACHGKIAVQDENNLFRLQSLGHGSKAPYIHKQYRNIAELSAQRQIFRTHAQDFLNDLRSNIAFKGSRQLLLFDHGAHIADRNGGQVQYENSCTDPERVRYKPRQESGVGTSEAQKDEQRCNYA